MGWWELAGEWLAASELVPHGRLGAELEAFLNGRELRPISVRKAAAVRRFVEELQREGKVVGAGRLAALPLERVEAAKRVARYGEACLAEFVSELLKGEKSFREMEELEQLIRAGAATSMPEPTNAHGFRLRGRSFRNRALATLPVLHPPPARWSPTTPMVCSCIEVTCDAVVLLPTGFLGFKVMPIPPRGGDRDRMRDNVRMGLANSRMFDEYVFL